MIPFSNVVAGIFIGIANDSWLARLFIPFIWGIIFCVCSFIFNKEEQEKIIEKTKLINKKRKFGLTNVQAFYFVEYMTATSTAFIFSVISGLIIGLF
jgi:hypothetical protein